MKNLIKGIFGLVIAFALISTGLSSCFGKKEDRIAEPTTLFQDMVGKPLPETIEKINDAGYTGTYIADGVDFTSFIDDVKDDYTTGEIKEDPDNKTAEVTLKLTSNIQAEQDKVALNEKLEEGKAWLAAKHYGQAQYGEDFELNFLVGKITADVEDPDTWFLKATCKVNGTEKVCESKVTGTSENPEVVYFDVY